MLLEVVSIYDLKLQAYSQPSVVPTTGVALRSFTDQVNASGSHLGAHPEDYSLVRLGTFNDVTGEFSQSRNENGDFELNVIINATDCVAKQ